MSQVHVNILNDALVRIEYNITTGGQNNYVCLEIKHVVHMYDDCPEISYQELWPAAEQLINMLQRWIDNRSDCVRNTYTCYCKAQKIECDRVKWIKETLLPLAKELS